MYRFITPTYYWLEVGILTVHGSQHQSTLAFLCPTLQSPLQYVLAARVVLCQHTIVHGSHRRSTFNLTVPHHFSMCYLQGWCYTNILLSMEVIVS